MDRIQGVAHQLTDFVEKLLMLMFSLEDINIWEFCCMINFLYCEKSLLLSRVQTVVFLLQSKSQDSNNRSLTSRSADVSSSFFLSLLAIWLLFLQKFTQLNFRFVK